jgi:hypothetical protein
VIEQKKIEEAKYLDNFRLHSLPIGPKFEAHASQFPVDFCLGKPGLIRNYGPPSPPGK